MSAMNCTYTSHLVRGGRYERNELYLYITLGARRSVRVQ